ncbi:MAG: hypothetical protein U0T77_07745 [Chitinophagales bacterium]
MPLFFNLGASYDFYTGMKSRAPSGCKITGWNGCIVFYLNPNAPSTLFLG